MLAGVSGTSASSRAVESSQWIVMQAKDIPDDLFIQAVAECSVAQAAEWSFDTAWCNRFDVEKWLSEHLGFEVPWKVVVAKARAMIRKGRMDGCTCGCRGDFDLRGFPDDPFVERATEATGELRQGEK